MARGSKYEESSSASEDSSNEVDGGAASGGGSSENTPEISDDAQEPALNEADEEEIEAVARSADPADEAGEEDDAEATQSTEDDDAMDEEAAAEASTDVGRREKARLKELQKVKKQKIQDILDAQNASIDADMNNKGKGRLKYLLQQTEIFAHFAKGSQSASLKKPRGRGRHASKVTEEEEDEEYLKEEEDALAGSGGTRLVSQPSCELLPRTVSYKFIAIERY